MARGRATLGPGGGERLRGNAVEPGGCGPPDGFERAATGSRRRIGQAMAARAWTDPGWRVLRLAHGRAAAVETLCADGRKLAFACLAAGPRRCSRKRPRAPSWLAS